MKLYFKFVFLAAINGLFLVSCSNDSSGDQALTPEGGVIKLVVTLEELVTNAQMGLTLIPGSEIKEGIPSVTYTNTGQLEELLLGIGVIDFDYTSKVHTFITSDEVHTLQTTLILPDGSQANENAYTIEIFFNDVLEYTDRNVTGPNTKAARIFKWSSDEGFEEDIFNSSL